ncbi:tetratricopeptide repeat protein [Thiomicrospira sp. R3]|uniref:tetratricopeptide repeat protein n=1 Tax=Thiomicrospira sp. R3 TaxID=3035472 RepID=UPI00259B62FC|nr:tetratricopeptide repeat protein [Thiomicrospira sp. R3]WFE67973.1 tetratricopeptide repeat protein [Thiomicrospira sp. R3]
MKNNQRWIMLPLIASLFGCTHLTNRTDAMTVESVAVSQVKLEPALMFELMLGEMLAERGDTFSAYNLLFPIAQKTGDVRLAERSFQLAMSAGFAQGIEQSAELWRSLDPMQASAWRVGYLMALRHDDLEAALDYWASYRKVSDLDLADDLRSASAQAIQATKPETAIAFFQALTRSYPDEWVAGFALGYVANHYNQPLIAVETLEDVATRLEAPVEVYFALSNLYVEQGLTERGLEFLATFIRQNPEQWMMQERYARLEVKAEQYLSAKARYQRIVEANPRAFTSLLSLALLQLELGELDAAEIGFRTLVNVEGYKDISYYYLGIISQNTENLNQAKRYLEQVSHPDYYLDANLMIAQLLVRLEGLHQGIDHLQALKPVGQEEQVKILRAQGIFHSQFDLWEQALLFYQQALDIKPDDLAISFAMAMALYELEMHDEYERLVTDLVKRYPNEPDALNALGYFYVEQNIKLDEAEVLLERALAIDPNRYYILDSRGWLEYQRGNYVEAEQYLQRAWSLSKDDEVLIHLIKVKWAQGKQQQAQSLWNEYAPIFPTNETLQRLINDLANP